MTLIKSFLRLLFRCYYLALPYGRLKLAVVLGLILFNGVLQLVGVTSVFPFFALCAEPDRIRNSNFGVWILSFLPPMNSMQMLVYAGCASIVLLITASLGSILSEIIRMRYAFGFCHWLRMRVFESYTERPYGYFLQRNPAELGQKLGDAMTFTQSVLLPMGECLTRIVMIILLTSIMFLVQPLVALSGILLFGGFYLFIFILLRPKIKAMGDVTLLHHIGFGKNTGQFLGGIKTVLVHNKGRFFMERALEHSEKIGLYQSKMPIYSNGPRYMLEPVAFGGLVAVVLLLAVQGRPFSDILPNLSVIALAAYRLLPALQLLYSQLVTISANSYTLNQLEDEISHLEKETSPKVEGFQSSDLSLITGFFREIRLDKISFQYPGTLLPTIEDFSLRILKNESLGIAGPSGAGKSTLVDIILGLHPPEKGKIFVDDIQLTRHNVFSWRELIGYVPQEIFLLDESVEENIAYGVDPMQINQAALRAAAEGAQILDFIESELPEGFKTTIGDRGVRLSGGQRQRLGLARALYHRPQILILDEATSALDNLTEAAVMETIHKLQGTLTIITIAHRLTTLERCDRIINLGENEIS